MRVFATVDVDRSADDLRAHLDRRRALRDELLPVT
jgi:hypothetical protein